MMVVIIYFIFMIPFLIFAIVLSKGKGSSLLAGYNTMSESKKVQYDAVPLCKFMGKVMYGVCFSILLLALSEVLNSGTLLLMGCLLLFGLVVFAMIYSNTGNRFKKQGK